MFRTPIPNAEQARLENCGPRQLLGLFASCLKTGFRGADYSQLSEAWGALFSQLYLSADDLVTGMQQGEKRLGDSDERMLQEFIAADCRSGGLFVLNVIKKGGMMDRAALIMIANLGDLTGIEQNGTTAIHLLADACDKGVRPMLIQRAGKSLLSTIYDNRGIPAIYTIFALGDICMSDLAAIAGVFSEEELKGVMCRNRTGKNAHTVFSEILLSLKSRTALDRHLFYKTAARKDTGPDRDI